MLVFVYVQFCISSTFIMLVLWNPFSVLAKWWYDKLEVSDIMFEIFWSMGLKAFLRVIKICRSIVRECVGKLAFSRNQELQHWEKVFHWFYDCSGDQSIARGTFVFVFVFAGDPPSAWEPREKCFRRLHSSSPRGCPVHLVSRCLHRCTIL